MRISWLVILFIVPTISLAQSPVEIESRLSHFKAPVDLSYDTLGFSSLPKFEYGCDDENEKPWHFYHVIDLNKDGRRDLIYSGPCMPYQQTAIFINDGQSLNPVHDLPGYILSIELNPKSTTIYLLDQACCCIQFTDYTTVTVHSSSKVSTLRTTFHRDTKIELGTLKEIKASGIIRTTPEIDDVEGTNTCDERPVHGNHLISVEKVSPMVQLANRGSWILVLYEQSSEQSWIGWIKK